MQTLRPCQSDKQGEPPYLYAGTNEPPCPEDANVTGNAARDAWRRHIGLSWPWPPAQETTPVLGGIVGAEATDGATVVWSDGPAVYGRGATAGEAMRNYAECLVDVNNVQASLRNPDALDSKAQKRQHLAACRGSSGDGPPTENVNNDDWAITFADWRG